MKREGLFVESASTRCRDGAERATRSLDPDGGDPEARRAVAIVGIGCRFPGGVVDPSGFWRLLLEGRDAIAEVPASRIDVEQYFDPRQATPGKMASHLGGFLDHIEEFDAAFFGISPREAERMDPQQRLLLETAWEAFEDAGVDVNQLEGTRTGVYVGQWTSDFESRLFADAAAVDFQMTTGSGRYAASGRVSYTFGLRGPSMTVDSACSSSLAAVHLAVGAIRSGECSMALAGGVNIILQPQISVAYSQSRMIAPDGHCKFGDASGDGYVRSEGVAFVLLKPLAQALADGDRIHAVVRGSAINNDGRSSGVLGRPSQVGHEEMLRAAYADAGVLPSRVGYVEAHGTGTRAGDPVELAALGAVMAAGRAAGSVCLVGSVKTNVGHTESAAGVAGLIKAALALQHGVVPASLHFVDPNPGVPWDELPLRIPGVASAWPPGAGPRVAGVNSFGISGSNAHVVLEQAPTAVSPVDAALPVRPALLVLSARSDDAVRAVASQYADLLERPDPPTLIDLCWQAATRRTPLERRAAFVAADVAEMAAALRRFAAGGVADATGVVYPGVAPKTVFVFPGQGAQWAGMARTLMASEPVFDETLRQCDAAARPYLDVSIRAQLLAEPGSPDWQLDRIDVVQPVLVALAIAYARLWQKLGVEPEAVVGHSMGEVGAAHVAGVLDLDQAMRIICRRSALMRRTSGHGAMALVELSLDEARRRIVGREAELAVAVSNSPRSSVISGDPQAVAEMLSELNRDDVFCRLVKVDVASHSPQMEPLAAELAAELAALTPREAALSIHSTVLARRAQGDEFGAAYWARNLRQPVRFADTVAGLVDEGANVFVELGPHAVLLPSVQQTAQAAGRTPATIACGERDADDARRLMVAVGGLWAAGVPIAWSRVLPAGRAWVELPCYPWQRERHWSDLVTMAAARGAASARLKRPDAEVLGWLHTLLWRAAPLAAAAANAAATVASAPWFVVAEETAQARALAHALTAAGTEARALALNDLAAACAAATWPAPQVLAVASDAAAAARWPLAVLHAVLGCSGAAAPRLWFVTQGAQAVAASPRARIAVNAAAAWGTARVVAEEHPDLWGGLVDLDPAQPMTDQAAALQAHLRAGDGEDQAALRDGERFVLRLVAQRQLPSPPFTWRADAAYLLTGGLGGAGLHIARAMAAAGARRLVLLNRTALPSRDQWATIDALCGVGQRIAALRELEAAGVAVHVAAVDVADAEQLAAFLQRWRAEAWPAIRGVVHAAGLFGNQLAARMDVEAFDAVLRSKLRSAQLLDRLLPDLDVFALFSSTGAFLAQAGQANYASANAGLDALAHDRRARGLPAHSIAWGVWRDTGLVKGVAGASNVAEMARQGLGSFAPDRGAALFGWLCGQDTVHTVALPADWAVFAQARAGRNTPLCRELTGDAPTATDGLGGAALAGRLGQRGAAERRTLLEAVVRDSVGQVLKLNPARIDSRRTFGSMGLSSLMAMELRNRLEAALARPLSATLAWNHPTVDELVRHLGGEQGAPAVPAAASTGVPAAPKELPTGIAELAAMSDEDALLSLRRGSKDRDR